MPYEDDAMVYERHKVDEAPPSITRAKRLTERLTEDPEEIADVEQSVIDITVDSANQRAETDAHRQIVEDLKETIDQAREAAGVPIPTLRVVEMSVKEQAEYIDEHGKSAFFDLPVY